VAFEAALAIVLGVALGVYLDRRFDTEPLFLFLFAALGFAVCFRRLLSIKPPDPPGGEPPPGNGGDNHT
jgi:F0F1-type ATP synthase assembly protein I